MSELDEASNGGLGLAFLLSEMRDLRKGMETRDERIHGSLDGVRSDLSTLSAKVDRSQNDVDAMRGDMQKLQQDVHAVREDVDGIMDDRKTEQVRKESAWSGPRKVLVTLGLVGSALGGITALIYFFGPAVIAALPSAG